MLIRQNNVSGFWSLVGFKIGAVTRFFFYTREILDT